MTTFALVVFAAVAVVLTLTVALFGVDRPDITFAGDGVLEGWIQFDGGWYRGIALNGYFYVPGQQSSIAFFPAYPLLMRAGAEVAGDPGLAGIVITASCGLGSAALFARWCASRMAPAATRVAVATLLVYPFAWYLYGAVYADALLLVCALGAFVLLESRHPVLAGLAGSVAAAARPTGIAVAVGLVALVLERRGVVRWQGGIRFRFDRAALRRVPIADAGVLLSLGGLLAYGAYLWVRWGSPLAFATVQEAPGWNQGSGPYTWLKIWFFRYVLTWAHPGIAAKLLVHALLTLGALLLVPRVVRRFGWAYGAYVVVAVGIPSIGSSTFMGLARYLLAAFPCFAVVGLELTERHTLRRLALGASALALVGLTAGYARGVYLS